MTTDYYGTQKYLITFYEGDYPDIDPNVPYKEKELLRSGLTIKPAGNRCCIEDETRHYFGAPIVVEMQDYDYDKIKRDFDFYKLPRIETSSREQITFTDGQKSFSMKKCESVHYLKKTVETMLVFRKREITKVKGKGFEMYSFLCSIFKKERGFTPLLGNTYVLSDTLIDKLERYEKTLGLSPLFDTDNPNIFFTVTVA
jgi:hypothetical protein